MGLGAVRRDALGKQPRLCALTGRHRMKGLCAVSNRPQKTAGFRVPSAWAGDGREESVSVLA